MTLLHIHECPINSFPLPSSLFLKVHRHGCGTQLLPSVWGQDGHKSEFWEGKVRWCTAKASRNHCVGVWWTESLCVDVMCTVTRYDVCRSSVQSVEHTIWFSVGYNNSLYELVPILILPGKKGVCCYGNIDWLLCKNATLQIWFTVNLRYRLHVL